MKKIIIKLIKRQNTTPLTTVKNLRDENVILETLGKICEYFQCDIGDIIEYKRKNEEEIK